MLTFILAAAIFSGIGPGAVEQFYYLDNMLAPPANQSELVQQQTDRIMTSLYGSNWLSVFVACEKTNRLQLKIMVEQYKTALGLPPTGIINQMNQGLISK